MRLAIAVLSLCMTLSISVPAAFAGEPLCGTSLENDERVRGVHERVRARGAGPAAQAAAAPPIVREGACGHEKVCIASMQFITRLLHGH